MAGSTGQIPGDVIDAIRPDLEAFASLWSALRTNYQGTNITKTVARLLHMYQPEDGVLAYERLLRTLYVLLEDFDGDGLRLLVSMVPPPKGVADEIIKRVFHKATGFVRLNAPIFHRNNTTNSEGEANIESLKPGDGNSDSRTGAAGAGNSRLQTVVSNAENPPEGTTILQAIVKSSDPPPKGKSPKVRPRDSEVFRGFPSNEITNTQCHARNMTHFYGPSMTSGGFPGGQHLVDYRDARAPSAVSIQPRAMDPSAYRVKWLEASNMVRKTAYDGSVNYPDLILKTADNKFIRLPVTKINGPPIGGYNSPYNNTMKNAYQNYYTAGQIHQRGENFASDPNVQSSRKMPSQLRSRRRLEKSDGSKDEDSTHSRIDLADHDYGFSGADDFSAEREIFDAADSPSDETIEKFRDTVKNTQRAIQEDIYRMDVVRFDENIEDANSNEKYCLGPEILTVTEELKKGASDFLKRAEDGKSLVSPAFPNTRMVQNPENFPRSKVKFSPRVRQPEGLKKHRKDVEKIEGPSENCHEEKSRFSHSEIADSSTKNSNVGRLSKAGRNQAASKYQEKMTNSSGSSTRNFADSIAGTNEMMHQANSMSELVNYRKQYYDALLSIQRAKLAVANSLAISSSQNSSGYDPRVFQYLQHQHQLLQQQQQRLLMAPQHTVVRQTMVQPGYASSRGAAAAGLWIRGSGDWNYSPCGQFAFPPQNYPMSSSPSCSAQTATKNASGDFELPENVPSRPSRHLHRTSRPATKRRKLEDIVEKLRDTDDSKLN